VNRNSSDDQRREPGSFGDRLKRTTKSTKTTKEDIPQEGFFVIFVIFVVP
jgi:hypothetical protein